MDNFPGLVAGLLVRLGEQDRSPEGLEENACKV